MKIQNPTNNEIIVKIFGNVYTLPAEGVLKNVPLEVAKYWSERLHEFLIVSEDDVVVSSPKKEAAALAEQTAPSAPVTAETIIEQAKKPVRTPRNNKAK